MREILFRGKRADGEWVTGNYVYAKEAREKNGVKNKDFHVIIPFCFDENMPQDDVIVKGETVGQYTGLKDKNGVKIFEGDVVRVSYKDTGGISGEGIVIFESGNFGVRYVGLYAQMNGEGIDLLSGITFEGYETVVEVTGNTHDNPELLGAVWETK